MTFLEKVGQYTFTHKWRVIFSWLVILGLLGGAAAYFYKPVSSAITIPGTPAQAALDEFSDTFPDAGKGTARIVFATPGDETLDTQRDVINNVADEVAEVDGVAQAISPFVDGTALSADGQVGYITLQLENEQGSVPEATTEAVTTIVNDARSDLLQVEMGGDIISQVPGEILGVGEVIGVVIAFVVLIMTLGSLIAAGMPILIAVLTVGLSMGGLFGLSQVIDITSTTPVLAVMLGLAVGIDYSLFIISKYRKYLLDGYSYKAAAGRAIATAGNAVLFAAGTVVIALSALVVVGIPFMSVMGLAGAATVAIAALVAVTLLPALLGVVGSKLFGKKTQRAVRAAQQNGPHESHDVAKRTFWYKWGETIVRRPVLVLLAAVVVVGAIAWPIKDLELGLPSDQYAAADSTERKAYDLLAEGFGEGFNSPLIVLVNDLPAATDEEKAGIRESLEAQFNETVQVETEAQQAEFEQRLSAASTAEEVAAIQAEAEAAQASAEAEIAEQRAQLDAQIEQYTSLYPVISIAETLGSMENVVSSQAVMASEEESTGVIQLIPNAGPSDESTIELINQLRDESQTAELTENDDVSLQVTGSAALQDDINQRLTDVLPIYLLTIVGLSLVLLLVAFRSILIPIKATLGFVLSALAMFGGLVAVFQWGWFGIAEATGPIVSFIPIIATGILFGLAMDYEFFLVSSIEEEHKHTNASPKQAVINGFALGSKVVTAAAIIMVSVFAGFIFNHDQTIQSIGFGLALGVFVDAFIVRMAFVPAVLALLGKSAWWLPKWLGKLLPNISIEGK